MAIQSPRREISEETYPSDTLISDLQSPELGKNKFQLLKPLNSAILCHGNSSKSAHYLYNQRKLDKPTLEDLLRPINKLGLQGKRQPEIQKARRPREQQLNLLMWNKSCQNHNSRNTEMAILINCQRLNVTYSNNKKILGVLVLLPHTLTSPYPSPSTHTHVPEVDLQEN